MPQQKYVLYCPKCGRVEGFVPESSDDSGDDGVGDADEMISEEIVRTNSGTSIRVRCPRCGGWVKSDRVRPV